MGRHPELPQYAVDALSDMRQNPPPWMKESEAKPDVRCLFANLAAKVEFSIDRLERSVRLSEVQKFELATSINEMAIALNGEGNDEHSSAAVAFVHAMVNRITIMGILERERKR